MAGYGYDRRGNRIRVHFSAQSAGICHSDGRYSRGSITSRRTHLMPSYEMTAEEANRYGSTLNVWQALRLLQTWHPLISYGQRFVGETDPYKRSLVVSEAVEWLAAKTESKVDDELVKHLSDVLRTKEGESLVRFCLALAGVQ
jgi:hypothetical protein